MEFAQIAVWLVVAAVEGQPVGDMVSHSNALAFVLPYLGPVAIFGFLVLLSRAATGLTAPARLSDAALAGSILIMVALAVNLRWTAIPGFFSGARQSGSLWPWRIPWLVDQILEPAAWLWFLVSFVHRPAPPLAGDHRRAAVWLASVLGLGALLYALTFGQRLVFFWWDFPPRGARVYYAWNDLFLGLLGAPRRFLLLFFAAAVWRMAPAGEPRAEQSA
jgi:hypothetical protein